MKAPIFKINATLIWAAMQFVSKDVSRYFINGVYIEPHQNGGVTITGTDGRRMFHCYDKDGIANRDFILEISKNNFWQLISSKNGMDTITTGPCADEDYNGKLRADILNSDNELIDCFTMREINGTYPDCKKIIAGLQEDGKLSSPIFNFKLLGDFQKVGKKLSKKFGIPSEFLRLKTGGTEDSPAQIYFQKGIPAFGVIMPACADNPSNLPEWFKNNVDAGLLAV